MTIFYYLSVVKLFAHILLSFYLYNLIKINNRSYNDRWFNNRKVNKSRLKGSILNFLASIITKNKFQLKKDLNIHFLHSFIYKYPVM
jgi:hypothetical protein